MQLIGMIDAARAMSKLGHPGAGCARDYRAERSGIRLSDESCGFGLGLKAGYVPIGSGTDYASPTRPTSSSRRYLSRNALKYPPTRRQPSSMSIFQSKIATS